MKCWGANDQGQLGLGDRKPRTAKNKGMGDKLPFVPVPGVSSIVSIDAGPGHTCALERGGKLWCWGEGAQRPPPGDHPPSPPAVVPLPGPVSAFALGSDHVCAVVGSGEIYCWGRSSEGALGTGDSEARTPGPELLPVDLGKNVRAVEVAVGSGHSCVRFESGRLKCFGRGSGGALGLGHTRSLGAAPSHMGNALPFVDLGTDFDAAAISGGGLHNCALSTDHRVKCWGSNRVGQLGLGHTRSPGGKPGQSRAAAPTGDARPVVDLGSSGRIVALRAGNTRTCVIIERAPNDLGLKCWGATVGDDPGEMGDALPFVELGADLVPVDIGVGAHTCAVLVTREELSQAERPTTGRLKCWGLDPDGATGIDLDPWAFERPDSMGDNLPFVDLGHDVGVVVGPLPQRPRHDRRRSAEPREGRSEQR